MMACQHPRAKRVTIRVNDKVAAYLNNRKRRELTKLEDAHEVQVVVLSREAVSPEYLKIDCEDGSGREVRP